MRAKEYLEIHKDTLKHLKIVQSIIDKLYIIRHDEQETKDFYQTKLIPDIRLDIHNEKYKEWEQLHLKYGASDREPQYARSEDEIKVEDAEEIRIELLKTLNDDLSFGYIKNSLRNKICIDYDRYTIEKTLREEISIKLDNTRKMFEELQAYSTTNEKEEEKTEDRRTMGGTAAVMNSLIYEVNKGTKTDIDNTSKSSFIPYITGFSYNTIRNQLSAITSLSKK